MRTKSMSNFLPFYYVSLLDALSSRSMAEKKNSHCQLPLLQKSEQSVPIDKRRDGRGMETIMPFLPLEIVTNILMRLPVKSLVRFRSVCKQWKNLLETPSFIAGHLNHSMKKPSLIFQQNFRGDPFCLYLIDHQMQLLQLLNVSISDPLSCIGIVDSTNGLVCLKIDVSGSFTPSFLLWNPATKQVRPVPKNIHDFKGNCRTAFGFTPIGNDYKIVMFHNDEDEDEDEGDDVGLSCVEVYSLCTDSWKEVDQSEILIPLSQIVTANGVMFCCGLDEDYDVDEDEDEDEHICLISFDLATENFARLPMPIAHCDGGFNLGLYENKLAMAAVTWGEYVNSFVLDLWVMEEGIGAFEERCTWTKKYTISFTSGFLFPSCIWKNEYVGSVNKALVRNSEAECEEGKQNEATTVLATVNFSTNEVRSFSFHIQKCIKDTALLNYVESLVPVGNMHIDQLSS